ncbi:MAG: hypothetical protein IE886_01240 [Campylobacterales bacterium]|nr:hypothetical protein [Campylobacterales bacterium]
MRVWIGTKPYAPEYGEHVAVSTAPLYVASISAKVTPEAPDFDVEPSGTDCLLVDETGSEVVFMLTPRRSGTFEVGAPCQSLSHRGLYGDARAESLENAYGHYGWLDTLPVAPGFEKIV